MKKWEYKVVGLDEEDATANEQLLNSLGVEGWELVAVASAGAGGKKGGPARAKKLTKAQRIEIARRSAQARWHKETTA